MGDLLHFIELISSIVGLITALIVIIRPLRNKILGIGKIQEGQKCLLRSDMLGIYYKHCDTHIIRQYEYENFLYLYAAYKELGGNSFVDKIKKEVDTWKIIT